MQGLHLTADLSGVDPALAVMLDADALAALCRAAVVQSGLSGVAELFHRFAPKDEQSGITGVVLLAESHLAVHTWPEHGVVTLDVFVCNVLSDNSARAEQLLNQLIQGFEPERHLVQRVRRAVPAVIPAASST